MGILGITVYVDYMDCFKMLKESMEVVEMETTTGVITALDGRGMGSTKSKEKGDKK